jgi:single-strand DNA-binding protein
MYANNCNFIGRLVADPELDQSKPANPRVTLTLALNKPGKSQAMYLSCVAWGAKAMAIAEYYRRGQPLSVSGEMEFGSYTDAAGVTRKSISLHIEKFSGGEQKHTSNGAVVPRPRVPE